MLTYADVCCFTHIGADKYEGAWLEASLLSVRLDDMWTAHRLMKAALAFLTSATSSSAIVAPPDTPTRNTARSCSNREAAQGAQGEGSGEGDGPSALSGLALGRRSGRVGEASTGLVRSSSCTHTRGKRENVWEEARGLWTRRGRQVLEQLMQLYMKVYVKLGFRV